MADPDYFQKALSNFMFDVASGGAIRHLSDLGYPVGRIQKQLNFPTPYERIQQTVWEHLLDKGVLRREEPGAGGSKETYEYVAEYDRYGRKSFRKKVLKPGREEAVLWEEELFSEKTAKELADYLHGRCRENGENTAYISCDFGLRSRREPERYQKSLDGLEEGHREYILGLPWERRMVYHRLDQRMREIAVRLYEQGEFTGTCYFMEIKKKGKIFG